jgi:8-oxo-dGTP pyrophosphatase MutT (NUDIX family)
MARTRRPSARDETSAGGVVFRIADDRALYLVIRDSYQNWGFPKGHIEDGEAADSAAIREVSEETGLRDLTVRGAIDPIDWYFKFRGNLIHKVCHFFLMQTEQASTFPQRAEGITACRWLAFDDAQALISYENARDVLRRANEILVHTPSV